MRTLRWWMGLAAVGSMAFATAAGCSSSGSDSGTPPADSDAGGGTDATTNPPGSDGGGTGTDGSSVVDGTTPTTISPAAGDLKLYLGQIAQLDASGSTITPASPPTFKWVVDSVPPGSAIVSASIFNAGSAKPSFTPDVVGDYKLKVVVTAGGAMAEKTVTVSAYEAQTIFQYTDTPGGGPIGRYGMRAAPTVTDAAARDLSCNVWDAGPYDNIGEALAATGADFWEGPPGSDSKVVWVDTDARADGGLGVTLKVVSTSSTCATAPTKLDEFLDINAGVLIEPRFSPNGSRVAYLSKPKSGDVVATIGADGSAKHLVAPFAVRPDGGAFPDASVPANNHKILSFRWLDDTKVGWLQLVTATTWQIVVADDADNSAPSIFMSCANLTGDTPTMFAFTPDGSVLVTQRSKFKDSGTPAGRDLLLYKPNATTKGCELVRNITRLDSDGGAQVSSVSEFSLSPDGTQVAYVLFDSHVDAGTGPKANAVWTASLDGLTPPAPLPGAPTRGANQFAGPRWLAGGALLAWPQVQMSVDAGDGGNQTIVVSPAGGGTPRVIANSSNGAGTKNVFAIGNGSACAIASASGSSLVAIGALAALVGAVARRRRRSK